MSLDQFKALKIEDQIIRALGMLKYQAPTQVQQEVIPFLLYGQDVIVQSQTGSGKTAAFGIPLCQLVSWEERAPQALVLTPTRELALQIQQELFNIGRFKRLKVASIFGRSSFEAQTKQLNQRTHIVVATPGRLLDHIQRGTIDLSQIKTVIIDEADEMLAMGFIEQVEKVLSNLPSERLTGLFSATMPSAIAKLANDYLTNPQKVVVAATQQVTERIEQLYYEVRDEDKVQLLADVLVTANPDSSIIFCNTREVVEEVASMLTKLQANGRMLHGGMEQRDRTKTIDDFRHGLFRFLVATDVAARGLDIANISLVVNFDLPNKLDTYTHRIGRTARYENHGQAVSFVNEYDGERFGEIEAVYQENLRQHQAPSVSLVTSRIESFQAKQARMPKLKKPKGHEFKEEIMKLHINAGKKTKMRAGDIVGAICQLEGVSAADIGVIDILDVSTFVEILNGKGPEVLKTLQKEPIKGRLRQVNQANLSRYEQIAKKRD